MTFGTSAGLAGWPMTVCVAGNFRGVGLRLGTALVSAVTVGLVVLVEQLSAGPWAAFHGPPWLWWTVYAAFLAVLLLDARPPSRWGPGPGLWLAMLCACAAAVYLLAPGLSFTAVCLVTSGASAAFVLGVRGAIAVVVAQTVVIALGQLGTPLTNVLGMTALWAGFQSFAALMAVIALREERTREELEAAQSRLRGTAAADERLRISRELHDLVGHQLTALALELEVASHRSDGDAAEHVERASRTAKELLTDLRRVVGRLRTTPDEVSAAFGAVTGIAKPSVRLDIDDDLEFTDPGQAHTLVRCVQEIVTNAVRHADADHLWITVTKDGPDVLVTARDDGRGAASVRPGNGLTGMRERLEDLGGALTVETEPDRGFRLRARLPAS